MVAEAYMHCWQGRGDMHHETVRCALRKFIAKSSDSVSGRSRIHMCSRLHRLACNWHRLEELRELRAM